jgi:hypothetical protein
MVISTACFHFLSGCVCICFLVTNLGNGDSSAFVTRWLSLHTWTLNYTAPTRWTEDGRSSHIASKRTQRTQPASSLLLSCVVTAQEYAAGVHSNGCTRHVSWHHFYCCVRASPSNGWYLQSPLSNGSIPHNMKVLNYVASNELSERCLQKLLWHATRFWRYLTRLYQQQRLHSDSEEQMWTMVVRRSLDIWSYACLQGLAWRRGIHENSYSYFKGDECMSSGNSTGSVHLLYKVLHLFLFPRLPVIAFLFFICKSCHPSSPISFLNAISVKRV